MSNAILNTWFLEDIDMILQHTGRRDQNHSLQMGFSLMLPSVPFWDRYVLPFWDRYARPFWDHCALPLGDEYMRDAEEIFRLQNGQDQRIHTERQGTPTSYRHIWTGCRACQAILILHLQLHFGTAMPLCASILGPLCASTGGRVYARCGGNLQATKWSGPKNSHGKTRHTHII